MSALRCAIYCRVSTDRQRERHTIDSQLRLLPEYAKGQGWKLVGEPYTDNGYSGETIEDRPAFVRLLDDVERGAFDVVLVVDIDRLTRSKSGLTRSRIFDHFRTCKVKLALPQQGLIDLEDENQELVLDVLGSTSSFEKRKFLRRTARGKREAAKQGRFRAGIDPYGLRWVVDPSGRNGCYEIREDEAKVVRRMYKLALTMGINMVAWTLNQEGHRTRNLKRGSRPNGGSGSWATSTVGKVLKSTTYKGEFRIFKGEDIPSTKVPAIIDSDTWGRVQETLRSRKPKTKYSQESQYLVSGVVRCGVCGYACWVSNARPEFHTRFAYYRCASSNSWRKMKMTGPCGNPHHRVDVVDTAIWEKILEVLRDPKLLAKAASIADKPTGVDWGAQHKAVQKKLAQLVKVESEVLTRRRRGLISEAACDTELREIAREREVSERNLRLAEQQLTAAGAKRRLAKDLAESAAALTTNLDSATFEERRQLVRLLVPVEHGGKVILHKDGSIEIYGALATPTATVELQLKTKAG